MWSTLKLVSMQYEVVIVDETQIDHFDHFSNKCASIGIFVQKSTEASESMLSTLKLALKQYEVVIVDETPIDHFDHFSNKCALIGIFVQKSTET